MALKNGGFMKIKVLSVIFAILSCISLFIVPVSASVELPIDVEERYTDISYLDETNVYGEVVNAEEEQELQTKKTVYIAVLSVLLVISIIILIVTLKRAKEDKLLKEEIESSACLEQMIGRSAEMQKVFSMIKKVAPAKASVLITGESGVGKELVANAIHNLSGRKDKAFIKVHCAALSESLLESELFGHEKGAYTGADSMQKGRFELAHGGTIFLDEIGEINQNVQIKILRVLQEKTFERVGGEKSISVDVRIVAATNKNLEEEVKAGRFREDLYYRLNVVHLKVPSLKERKDDLPLLIDSFIKKFAAENEKEIIGIDSKAKAALLKYDWPGNIRQLQNCIESSVVMSNGKQIKLEDLPLSVSEYTGQEAISIPMGISLEDAEKIIIMQNLSANKGNKSKTADVLGIGRKTLHRKLNEYGLELSDDDDDE